jgi:biopolymer transport protein TolR
MQLGEPGKMQASINITPLVDVVLVLLIIFMVMAPSMMRKGPEIAMPETTKPREQGDERGRIIVTVDADGLLYIDDVAVQPETFADSLRLAVGDEEDPKVVIRGDSRLHFREIREAMSAVEGAGFQGVGLIAKKRAGGPAGAKGD